MTRRDLKHTEDVKLMIIQNFIDYYTSDDKEREEMYSIAWDYIREDHIDEIESAFEVSKFNKKLKF